MSLQLSSLGILTSGGSVSAELLPSPAHPRRPQGENPVLQSSRPVGSGHHAFPSRQRLLFKFIRK